MESNGSAVIGVLFVVIVVGSSGVNGFWNPKESFRSFDRCASSASSLALRDEARDLAARFGIARERVVAVGDADNDLEMLRGAGLGVAMGNGTESA